MIYDIKQIKEFYASYQEKVGRVRALLARPLTYAEKVLLAHEQPQEKGYDHRRGADYALYHPNRVCMQDATAQMAILQFMNAGKTQTAVPSTVHCDHLIRAQRGAADDLAAARETNAEVYTFLQSAARRFGMGF